MKKKKKNKWIESYTFIAINFFFNPNTQLTFGKVDNLVLRVVLVKTLSRTLSCMPFGKTDCNLSLIV